MIIKPYSSYYQIRPSKVNNVSFESRFDGVVIAKAAKKITDRLTNELADCTFTLSRGEYSPRYNCYINGKRVGFMDLLGEHITTIDTREGNKEYKYIGKTLLELAEELSYRKGRGGKVTAKPQDIGGGSPLGFYEKMGFKDGELVAEEILKRRKRVKANPILPFDRIPELQTERQWLDYIYDWAINLKQPLPKKYGQQAYNLASMINTKRYNPEDYSCLL